MPGVPPESPPAQLKGSTWSLASYGWQLSVRHAKPPDVRDAGVHRSLNFGTGADGGGGDGGGGDGGGGEGDGGGGEGDGGGGDGDGGGGDGEGGGGEGGVGGELGETKRHRVTCPPPFPNSAPSHSIGLPVAQSEWHPAVLPPVAHVSPSFSQGGAGGGLGGAPGGGIPGGNGS